jgi:hypothetical protein
MLDLIHVACLCIQNIWRAKGAKVKVCFQALHVKCGIHVLVYYLKFYIFTHNSQLYALNL